MKDPCLKLMEDAEELTQQMLRLVDRTEFDCESNQALNIHGVIRDCAYKIQRIVQNEKHLWVMQKCPNPTDLETNN